MSLSRYPGFRLHALGLCSAERQRAALLPKGLWSLRRGKSGTLARVTVEKHLTGKLETPGFGARSSGLLCNSVSQLWLHIRNFWKALKKTLMPELHHQDHLCALNRYVAEALGALKAPQVFLM